MLIALVDDDDHDLIPPLARSALLPLFEQLRKTHEKVGDKGRQIHAWHRSNELSRQLETIPRRPYTCMHPTNLPETLNCPCHAEALHTCH